MTNTEAKAPPLWLGWTRLGLGLAQGGALYALSEMQETPMPAWLTAAWVTAVLVPVLVIGGLGAMRWLTLGVWTAIALAISAGLSWYIVARLPEDQVTGGEMALSFFVVSVLLFIGHHMVAASDEARRWIAPYERYFDLGWRHGAQLVLAMLFTGAFWAMLGLGSALFNLIGIHFLTELIQEKWFAYPATAAVFAAAVHLTDMRSGLVHGARALGLVLLSWLLPAMTLLAAAFFIALPFTGLEPLWATRAATLILLVSAGALVILINAAYQDGVSTPNIILRWSARIASVLMTPLAALAAYALYLRIAQYGLTPERIYALAVLVIGACYAIAYAIGAFWPRWMKPLEIGNLASAVVVMLVAIALFTPIADPARLSVANQLSRLESGRVSAADFDVTFLRFDGARYGQEALRRLQQDQSTPERRELAERAEQILAVQSRWQIRQLEQARQPLAVVMRQDGAVLPDGFADDPDAYNIAVYCAQRDTPCNGFLLDLNSDGVHEVLMGRDQSYWVFGRNEAGRWRQIAVLPISPELDRILGEGGDVRVVPAQVGDIMVGGTRLMVPRYDAYGPRGEAWPPEPAAASD